jgi:DNA repair protein RadC
MRQPTLWNNPTTRNDNTLHAMDRPIERLYTVGEDAISNIEILALLIGGSRSLATARDVFASFHSWQGIASASIEQLERIDGVGKSAAARIRAALEIRRRIVIETFADRPQIKSPSDAAAILLPWIGNREQENIAILYCDTRNYVVHQEILYRATLNTSLVRTCEVFRCAIRKNSANIIIAHNHPSGDPNPSPEDIALTRRLVEAGKLLEIEVLDHFVIGHNRYISLRERGLGFET